MKKFLLIGRMNIFLFTCFLVLQFVSAFAQPGSLDPTFGIGGKLTDWSGRANGVAIQADGKIVTVGATPLYQFAVARYNPDGSPDNAFGNAGKVAIPIQFITHVFGVDVAIQPDGKIVVTCYDDDQGFGAIVRLNANGSLDTSFGTNGTVHTTGGSYSVAIQPDGKIITSAGVPFNNPFNFRIRRYNTNGSVDTTFGSGGITDLAIFASAVVLQADGKIVAAGQASNAFAIARLNSDGTADETFGSGGLVTAPIGEANSVSIQTDGKIVAVGRSSATTDYSLVRYNPNGSLDTTFDNDGIVALADELCCWLYYSYRNVVALRDGRIVVSGTRMSGSNNDFAIGRYNSDGSLDTTFGGGDGVTTVDFNNSNDHANAMAVDTQGRAVVVGESNGSFALARFRLNAQAPFDFDGDSKTDIGVTRQNAGTMEWWISRSGNASVFATAFGAATDIAVPGDYTGDGKADVALFRPSSGEWFVLRSEDNTFFAFPFGLAGDIPAPADYDNDGKADAAIFRSGTWFISQSGGGGTLIAQFGTAGDLPVPADYDNDGKDDIGIIRDNGGNREWWIQRSTAGLIATVFGITGDKAVQGDYTGDGKADIAVFRASEGNWYVLRSEDLSYFAFPFGQTGDIPVPGDYDGDGRFDAGVFRPSIATWFINRSGGSGTLIAGFGVPTDIPMPSVFVR